MLKKTITYKDLDDNPVTEDFYFNLSKAEVLEMEVSVEGGLAEHFKKITEAEKPDGKVILKTFKDFILSSVGRRSEDGKRFIKSPEITAEFEQSNAYSEFLMELSTDAASGAQFLKAVIPSDLAENLPDSTPTMQTVQLPGAAAQAPASEGDVPEWVTSGRVPTEAELRDATPEQMKEAFRRKGAQS